MGKLVSRRTGERNLLDLNRAILLAGLSFTGSRRSPVHRFRHHAVSCTLVTEWTIGVTDVGTRLDKFLAGADRLGSRGKAAAALERGKIYINGVEALMRDASRALVEGDHVRFWVDRPGSAKSRPRVGITDDLDVIYEDSRLIVVNKPA